MTKEEAIKNIKAHCYFANLIPQAKEALDVAIKALEQEPRWIPISERLPEENVPVLLGIRFKDDFKYFVSVRMDYNYWSGMGRELKGTGYWMPLPESYKAESEDKE